MGSGIIGLGGSGLTLAGLPFDFLIGIIGSSAIGSGGINKGSCGNSTIIFFFLSITFSFSLNINDIPSTFFKII